MGDLLKELSLLLCNLIQFLLGLQSLCLLAQLIQLSQLLVRHLVQQGRIQLPPEPLTLRHDLCQRLFSPALWRAR